MGICLVLLNQNYIDQPSPNMDDQGYCLDKSAMTDILALAQKACGNTLAVFLRKVCVYYLKAWAVAYKPCHWSMASKA